MYGIMYGVKRTTVYLPEELKARLEAAARTRGVTEAEIVRQAVDKELRRSEPRGGIFTAEGGPHGADLTHDRKHEWLKGFGES